MVTEWLNIMSKILNNPNYGLDSSSELSPSADNFDFPWDCSDKLHNFDLDTCPPASPLWEFSRKAEFAGTSWSSKNSKFDLKVFFPFCQETPPEGDFHSSCVWVWELISACLYSQRFLTLLHPSWPILTFYILATVEFLDETWFNLVVGFHPIFHTSFIVGLFGFILFTL